MQYLHPPTTTSKLQLNYRTTIIRTTWNIAKWKSYNQAFKEETTLRLVGGVGTQNRLVSLPRMADKNWKGYLSCRGPPPPKEQEAQSPHQDPQARVAEPRREVPITSGYKNQQGLWLREMEGFWNPGQFLKGQCMDLLGLIPSELQCWGSSLKGTRDI